MYIQVDQQHYYILLQDDIQEITVINKIDDIIHLRVPVRYTEDQLRMYIKTQNIYIKRDVLQINATIIGHIMLFEKKYTILPKVKITTPYIQNTILYVPTTFRKADKHILALREFILQDAINKAFTFWEERLDILLPEFKLRKLQTNSHYICRNIRHITIARHLIDKSKDFFWYIIAEIALRHTNLSQYCKEQKLEKHVKNWRLIRKILLHEQHPND